jgi:hypothetical protein
MELQPEGWLAFEDPFPAWRIAPSEGEEDASEEDASYRSGS